MKKKRLLIIIGIVVLLFLLLLSMRIIRRPQPLPLLDTSGKNKMIKRIKTLTTNGGRVAWSPKGDLIAFDRKEKDGYFDIWLMKSDGSEQKCLTCDKGELPSKNIGNPGWHPSGEYLIFQAEDPDLQLPPGPAGLQKYVASPGIGLNNNLWLMTADGLKFWQFTHVKHLGGVLHPHFSSDGKKLLWSEIIPGGKKSASESTGRSVIQLADFAIENGEPRLSNIQTLRPKALQLYETHGFSPDGRMILFSALGEGKYFYDLEIYTVELSTGRVVQLTENDEWDEHAHFTPDGRQIIWSGSEGNPQLKGKSITEMRKNPPRLDLWIMNADGSNKSRLTFFNDPNAPKYQSVTQGVGVGDCAWSPDGKMIVTKLRPGRGQETIVLIELN